MARQRFRRSLATTLDAAGDGQVTIQPPGVDWLVTLLTVATSTAVLTPEARVYVNGTSDADLIEGSYNGARDTSDTEHPLTAGDRLIVKWTGGDAGARATVRVSGWQYPFGQLEA